MKYNTENLTLALNSSWNAINLIGYKDVMRLLCKGHCRAVDENFVPRDFDSWMEYHGVYEHRSINHNHKKLKTVSLDIPVPEIVVMINYKGMPKRIVTYSKENLFVRDGGECQYCGAVLNYSDATIDHIHPKSKGGLSTFENTVLSCRSCNHDKDDYLLEQLDTHTLRSKPKRPNSTNPLYRWQGRIEIKESWKHFLSKY